MCVCALLTVPSSASHDCKQCQRRHTSYISFATNTFSIRKCIECGLCHPRCGHLKWNSWNNGHAWVGVFVACKRIDVTTAAGATQWNCSFPHSFLSPKLLNGNEWNGVEYMLWFWGFTTFSNILLFPEENSEKLLSETVSPGTLCSLELFWLFSSNDWHTFTMC